MAVMNIRIISLPRSKERRERITNQLNQLAISFEFHDATSIENIPCDFLALYDERKFKKIRGYYLKNTELACFYSHFSLWKTCLESNQPLIILEDNVDINVHFHNIVDELKESQGLHNLIKLSGSKRKVKHRKLSSINTQFSIIKHTKPTSSAMGYILYPNVAKKLIDGLKSITSPVDDYMEKTWLHKCQIISIYPYPVCRANIDSTIGSNRKEKINLTFKDKIVIESYRLHEQILNKLHW
ncbi:glycosyltransferase family 25 protein [Vibrio vulnificus]|uniref:glycosyltransferase family 25 protein n=1 Tax=Vibrio vulnificus TaxID=672 RepID=UPI001CDC521A|nr:glycosyltransferase family 25 protein [Vibrio vulnificus]MCA3953711.1 glycosyltransferase family 25 protein [Vibrio vulnificus]